MRTGQILQSERNQVKRHGGEQNFIWKKEEKVQPDSRKGLDEEGNKLLDKDIFSYVKNYIPNNTAILISTIKDALYYLFNGFTLVLFDDEKKIIAFENKANLTSSVQRSENEKSLKGPLDAFTENYQSNIGMIRRRLKTEDLWIKEVTVGEKSKTKVALFYLNGVCDKKLVDKIYKKIMAPRNHSPKR